MKMMRSDVSLLTYAALLAVSCSSGQTSQPQKTNAPAIEENLAQSGQAPADKATPTTPPKAEVVPATEGVKPSDVAGSDKSSPIVKPETANQQQAGKLPVTPQTDSDIGTQGELVLMESSDIHTYLVPYDYYKDKPDENFGLAKVATIVKEVRAHNPNTMLLDNGDLIQGNLLGDWHAEYTNPLKNGQLHAVHKAMNLMKYDVGNLGNHEFNYGLPFLQSVLKGAKFDIVNANVYKDPATTGGKKDVNFFKPYVIVNKKIGNATIRVGVLGLVPPQVVGWDKSKLQGKVVTEDMTSSAKKFVPQMKREGADIVVVVAHSGVNPVDCAENAVYCIARDVPGIDAFLMGHSHKKFPGDKMYDKQESLGIDNVNGKIKGIPAVMPNMYGSHLGLVTLNLKKTSEGWKVLDSKVELKETKAVKPDAEVLKAISFEHEKTLEYIRKPVGSVTAPIESFHSRVEDTPLLHFIADAQLGFFNEKLKNPAYKKFGEYPVLSAAAPFKTGYAGSNDYTEIATGKVSIKSMADIYLYPNTFAAEVLTGAEVLKWLEASAKNFNQIDPKKEGEFALLNEKFSGYNFDGLYGKNFSYQIDITQPEGSRIFAATFNGVPIDPAQKFVVLTNNFRLTPGKDFPVGIPVDLGDERETRKLLVDYVLNSPEKTVKPTFEKSWTLKPIDGAKGIYVYSTGLAGKKSLPKNATIVSEDTEKGLVKVKIELSLPQN